MNEKDVWNLFKITGKIEYYIKYKSMLDEKSGNIGNYEGRGSNS